MACWMTSLERKGLQRVDLAYDTVCRPMITVHLLMFLAPIRVFDAV